MKKILLLGDSIMFGAPNSIGYGALVKEKLGGRAEVYYPNENCRFAQYTLRLLYDLVGQLDATDIDTVHFNNGLWDVIRLYGDEPLTPIDAYADFLRRICKMLSKLFPKAKIIFASTTNVIEEWANPNFMRYNSEIEEYNRVALAVMREQGIQVNDLHGVSITLDETCRADWVHYNDKGCEVLADAVIKSLGM